MDGPDLHADLQATRKEKRAQLAAEFEGPTRRACNNWPMKRGIRTRVRGKWGPLGAQKLPVGVGSRDQDIFPPRLMEQTISPWSLDLDAPFLSAPSPSILVQRACPDHNQGAVNLKSRRVLPPARNLDSWKTHPRPRFPRPSHRRVSHLRQPPPIGTPTHRLPCLDDSYESAARLKMGAAQKAIYFLFHPVQLRSIIQWCAQLRRFLPGPAY